MNLMDVCRKMAGGWFAELAVCACLVAGCAETGLKETAPWPVTLPTVVDEAGTKVDDLYLKQELEKAYSVAIVKTIVGSVVEAKGAESAESVAAEVENQCKEAIQKLGCKLVAKGKTADYVFTVKVEKQEDTRHAVRNAVEVTVQDGNGGRSFKWGSPIDLLRKVLPATPAPIVETRGNGRYARVAFTDRFHKVDSDEGLNVRNNEIVPIYTHPSGRSEEVKVGYGLVVSHDKNSAWLEIYNSSSAGVRTGYYVR